MLFSFQSAKRHSCQGVQAFAIGLAAALALAGCSAPTGAADASATADAASSGDATTAEQAPTATPALSESEVIAQCSAALQERFFDDAEVTFESLHPADLASARVRDGEWIIVFRPAQAAEAAISYFCHTEGTDVIPMTPDEHLDAL